jgi:hypothetical protein
MNLFDLVKKALVDTRAIEELIFLFDAKQKKSLFLTNKNDREDLSQELKIKMIQNIRGYDINSIPGFWEMKDKINKEGERKKLA